MTMRWIMVLAMLAMGCGGGAEVLQDPNKDVNHDPWEQPDIVQPLPDAVTPDTPLQDMLATPDTPLPDSVQPAPDLPIPDPDPDPEPWPSDITYTGIYSGMESLTGTALLTELCGLVKSGFDGISYDDAQDVIFDVVDNNNGQVLEVYTGDSLAASDKDLNLEHTWPQSLGATGQAKSDLFHLFPTYQTFNSARGNLPFGNVVTRDWPPSLQGNVNCQDAFSEGTLGCFSFRGKDASGIKVFEPRDAHKGNVARAVFYFAIRYGTNCKVKSLKIYDPAHASVTETVYKKWNRLDPPDDRERLRNTRIENIQNTRNPFIDHPEFADRLSFL